MYHLAKLRPYSCPKCGSFLEVDREQDNFDCPFCGSRFDAVSFHGKDLLEQAAECIHSKEFRKALEKYDYLLSKRPEKFEYLYGYACAVGGMSSLDDYDDPKKYNVKLAALLSNDPRFRTGPAGPYFRKLSEMHSLARRRSKLLTEQKTMETKVWQSLRVYMKKEDITEKLEEKDKELRKEIKDFQNKLIEMDNKLY